MLPVLICNDHFRTRHETGGGCVLSPVRAAFNPAFEQINLRGRERLAFRGHPLILVLGANQFDQPASAGLAGHDSLFARLTRFERSFPGVKPKTALLLFGSVTFETML